MSDPRHPGTPESDVTVCGDTLADLTQRLREPLAACRALLELLGRLDSFDAGVVHGYLTPALQQVMIACGLVDDAVLLTNGLAGSLHLDETEDADLESALEGAVGTARIGGDLLPNPEFAGLDEDGIADLTIACCQTLLERLLRSAIEVVADTAPGRTTRIEVGVIGDRASIRVHRTGTDVRELDQTFLRAVLERLAGSCNGVIAWNEDGLTIALPVADPASPLESRAA